VASPSHVHGAVPAMTHSKKIVLAPQSRMEAVQPLAERFFAEVLGYDLDDCLVTDESDLYDFADPTVPARPQVEAMLDRLEAHYLIDGRIGSTCIVDLLEFLRERGVTG
jgi:hypothetical protein